MYIYIYKYFSLSILLFFSVNYNLQILLFYFTMYSIITMYSHLNHINAQFFDNLIYNCKYVTFFYISLY